MRVFVDTNIFLDYLLERKGRKGEDLDEYAFRFFERTLACEFEIIISRRIIEELSDHIDIARVTVLLAFLKPKLTTHEYTLDETEQARMLSYNKSDALHALIAHRENAYYLITRNIKDFREFSFIQAKLPEQL